MSPWGNRADYVARFKSLSNTTLPELPTPPKDLTVQLTDKFNLTWDDLPPLAQRALLWDSGYVLGSGNAWIQVRLPCTSSRFMADIAFTQVFPGTTKQCTGGTRGVTYDATALSLKATCALYIKSLDLTVSNASVYSQDGLPDDAVPEPRVFLHTATDNSVIPAIHTTPRDQYPEPSADKCPSVNGAAMTIPCAVLAFENDPEFCFPQRSTVMTDWLKSISQLPRSPKPTTPVPTPTTINVSAPTTVPTTAPLPSPTSESDVVPVRSTTVAPTSLEADNPPPSRTTLHLGLGIGGGVLFVCLVAFFVHSWYRRRRWRQHMLAHNWNQPQYPQSAHHGLMPTPSKKKNAHSDYDTVVSPLQSLDPPRLAAQHTLNYSIGPSETSDPSVASDMPPLTRLEPLGHLKLALESLEWDKLLDDALPAVEIYYGQYLHYHPVAIKLMRVDRAQDHDVVASFVQEILWMSRLNHPGIVGFMGFAWDEFTLSPSSLMAVTEFYPQGSLPAFLSSNRDLDWGLKGPLALYVASALYYLHSINIVHRNLTSQSVWMDWPQAKLNPLNISATHAGAITSAAHVAPEIVRSAAPTSMASDIYALGCILCEIDSHTAPTTRPKLSDKCPDAIFRLVLECLDADPRRRPTAKQVVEALDIFVDGENVGGFV
ncbi:unnamed protein product [Aphanomyces euteiches]